MQRQIRISDDLDVQSNWNRLKFNGTNYEVMLSVPKSKKRCSYWDQHLEGTEEKMGLEPCHEEYDIAAMTSPNKSKYDPRLQEASYSQ